MLAAGVMLFTPASDAEAAHTTGLLERVNEAIRDAGAPVTVARSDAFQAGVINGHYTSYDQLVGAIIFHKTAEALPSFSSTLPHASVNTDCLTGTVISIAPTALTVEGDDESGTQRTEAISIATNQYDIAIERGVTAGVTVKSCSVDDFASQYGHVTLVTN